MTYVPNVIGFDDGPFDGDDTGEVTVVGAVFADLRLDGVLVGTVERDGADGAQSLSRLVSQSKFSDHVQLVMLQGITFGGFNVVDAHLLRSTLKVPVLVVARREPNMDAVHSALTKHVSDGAEKWRLIEALGPMEKAGEVYVQRVGISLEDAKDTVKRFSIHSQIPEPLRVAHLVAGALCRGVSRGRP